MLCELVDHVQNIKTQNTFPLYQLRVDQLKVNNSLCNSEFCLFIVYKCIIEFGRDSIMSCKWIHQMMQKKIIEIVKKIMATNKQCVELLLPLMFFV